MNEHTGIRLRLSIPAGAILDANSDHLYYMAKFGGLASICLPQCLPGCDEHGWFELIPGESMSFSGAGELRVEIKPVMLHDPVPDG